MAQQAEPAPPAGTSGLGLQHRNCGKVVTLRHAVLPLALPQS